MISKKIIFFFIIIFFQVNYVYSSNVIIVTKVNNEILTNIDIENESKYLLIINANLENLRKNELLELSKNSLIRQILKKEEIIRVQIGIVANTSPARPAVVNVSPKVNKIGNAAK